MVSTRTICRPVRRSGLPKIGENPGDVIGSEETMYLVWFHISAAEVHTICVQTRLFNHGRKVHPPKDTGVTIVSRFYDNVRFVLAGIGPVLASIGPVRASIWSRSGCNSCSAPLSFTLMMRSLVFHRESYFPHPFTFPPACLLTFAFCARAFERASVKYPACAHPRTSQLNDHKSA